MTGRWLWRLLALLVSPPDQNFAIITGTGKSVVDICDESNHKICKNRGDCGTGIRTGIEGRFVTTMASKAVGGGVRVCSTAFITTITRPPGLSHNGAFLGAQRY